MHQLKLYGLGGQGVVTAAKLLVEAVTIHEGKYGRSLPAYGHERRGAPVYADVMIAERPILLSSFVYHPDLVVLFETSLVGMGVKVEQGVGDHTVLVVNASSPSALPDALARVSWYKIYFVDATAIALEAIGRPIVNGPMLGAIAKTGIVDLESICRALVEGLGSAKGERSVRAARDAYSHVQEQ
jgi:pyruvate ferredoxin oxidoreductase gamma subunit